MFTNKIALVTGGARGIGEAIVRVLARDGANVVISDINQNGCQKVAKSLENPEDHLPVSIDVSKRDSVMNMMKDVHEKFSKSPQIVVNAAGIIKPKTISKMSDDMFDKIIEINLRGTYLVNQITANAMKESNLKGCIINISSLAGT